MRETSIDAYHAVLPALSPTRARVYSFLFNEGPSTGREINEALGTSSAHKRLSELRRQGVIAERDERKCKVSGQSVITWGVTDATAPTPLRLNAEPAPTKSMSTLERENADLLEENGQLRKKIARLEAANPQQDFFSTLRS